MKKFMIWLVENDMSKGVCAEKLDISRSYLYQILHGQDTPSRRLAKAIQDLTGGDITIADILPNHDKEKVKKPRGRHARRVCG